MAHFIDNATHKVVANVLVDSRPRRAVWTAGRQGGVGLLRDRRHRQRHRRHLARDHAQDQIRRVRACRRRRCSRSGSPSPAIGKLAFVALGPANRVAVVDAQTYEVKKYLLVGQRVWNLAFTPDESRLYTTNGVSNDISVIDVPDLRVLQSVPVGAAALGRGRAAMIEAAASRPPMSPDPRRAARRRGGARRRGSEPRFRRARGACGTSPSRFIPATSPCCSASTAPARRRCSRSSPASMTTRSGAIRIFGAEIKERPSEALARIGVVFQQPTLDLDLTVAQNLLYHAALHGMSRRLAGERIAREVERVGLPTGVARQGAAAVRRPAPPRRDRARAAASAEPAAARRAHRRARHREPPIPARPCAAALPRARGWRCCGRRI